MKKMIAVTVLPACKLGAGTLLMESVQMYLPSYDRCVVCLDSLPEGVDPAQLPFQLLPARELWDAYFLDNAFFYNQEEFRQATSVRVLQWFDGRYEACLLLYPDSLFLAPVPGLAQAPGADAIVSIEAPPIYKNKRPPMEMPVGRFDLSMMGLDLVGYGPAMRQFLAWVDDKFAYMRRIAVTAIDKEQGAPDNPHPDYGFYQHWMDYSHEFGCGHTLMRPLVVTSDYSCEEDGRAPMFACFAASPTELFLEGHPRLAEVYEAYKTAADRLPGLPEEYAYDRFEDGTPVFPLLREYFFHDYRLRTACGGDPFACRAQFTDATTVLGELEGVPLTATLAAIYRQRGDLREAFPDIQREDRIPCVRWFLLHGVKEYELPAAYSEVLGEKCEQVSARLEVESRRFGNRVRRRLHMAPPQKPLPVYPEGVNLVGYVRGDFGLGEHSRSLARLLTAGEVPLSIVEVAVPQAHVYSNTELAGSITNTFDHKVNLIYVNAAEMGRFFRDLSPDALRGHYNIGYWAWEQPEFPDAWCHLFEKLDEIWTISAFSAEAIRAKSSVPVFSLPPAVVVGDVDKTARRADFGIPEDSFAFLMMYSAGSIAERKNPRAVVEAFDRAFGNDTRATLFIKASGLDAATPEDLALLRSLEGRPNVRLYTDNLPRARLNALINLCDAYVSLHRSEGFGLGPAEAMYLGKPAIVTGWSGNMEYTTPEVCCPVAYKLVTLEKDYGPYRIGTTWSEPDVEDAARQMRRLAEDPALAQKLGAAGAALMRDQFSPEVLGEKARARLETEGLLGRRGG